MKPHYNVLFLCTGNSVRSIMAEGIMNFKGSSQFRAYSAGSHPSGKVRPEALRELEVAHISTNGFRSEGWDEFSKPDAPRLDFVFTVWDNAANEVDGIKTCKRPSETPTFCWIGESALTLCL
jgi:arsenate reductase